MKDIKEKVGVILELDKYKLWVQSSCNGYFAQESNGKIKSKGSEYKLKPESYKESLFGSIIRKAVMDKYITGAYIRETIVNHKDYRDFLMSASVDKQFFIKDGSRLREKKIRYIYSKNGLPLKVGNGSEVSIFAGGNKINLLLECTENIFPWDDVDYDIYVQKANDLYYSTIIFTTTKGTPQWYNKVLPYVDELYANSAIVYDEFTKIGLTLIPKVGKSSYTGVKPSDSNTWGLVPKDRCLGYGIVTGKETGILTIDIDAPENLDGTLLELIRENPSLKIFAPF